MSAPVASEHDEQKAFIRWFRMRFPGVLVHSIPNGAHLAGDAKRRAMQMQRLKDEGLVVGIPDTFIPKWATYVEMQPSEGGVVSPEQAAIHADLRRCGYVVIVAHGWDEAREALLAARPNLRAAE